MLSLRSAPSTAAAAEAAAPVALPMPASEPRALARPPQSATTPAAARPLGRRHRRPLVSSFLLVVAAPVAAAAVYLFAVAANQYVSEFRFTLRTAVPVATAPVWLFGTAAAPSRAAADSRILVQYVASRAIVDDLDRTLDLRRIYSPPAADWWARLHRPAPIESLVRYWHNQVASYYDPADATVVIRVRAFSPRDALSVARAVSAACERLVNNLSAQMRRDALHEAEGEVAASQARLAAVLGEIRALRDRDGLIDPAKTAAASAALAARVEQELVAARTRLATLRTYMQASAPEIKVTEARIRSLEAQQQALAHPLADPGAPAGETLSGAVAAFEALESRREFAEDAYRHALAGLDRARADADRQQVYIADFVPPSLAQQPLYPRRWRTLGVVALIAFASWAIGRLTLLSIRDHM